MCVISSTSEFLVHKAMGKTQACIQGGNPCHAMPPPKKTSSILLRSPLLLPLILHFVMGVAPRIKLLATCLARHLWNLKSVNMQPNDMAQYTQEMGTHWGSVDRESITSLSCSNVFSKLLLTSTESK